MASSVTVSAILAWTLIWTECKSFLSAAPQMSDLKPFFRNDYAYIPQHDMFIKIHHFDTRYWVNARSICAQEGANLAVIKDETEAVTIVDMLNKANPKINAAWIGVHDIFIEGEFMTIKGESAKNYFYKWALKQPDNANGGENCVVITNEVLLKDWKCDQKASFICKKEAADVELNTDCMTYDKEYQLGPPNSNRCFKLHKKQKTWSEALKACTVEEGALAIIRTSDEAKVLVDILAKNPADKLHGNFNKDIILMGFHDRFAPGEYLTLDGNPLEDLEYGEWDAGQPDNAGGREHCGSVLRNGKLNDCPCNERFMFFCERTIVDSRDVSVFSRFQEIE